MKVRLNLTDPSLLLEVKVTRMGPESTTVSNLDGNVSFPHAEGKIILSFGL